ncbi:MAG: GNAT family N-acetyltransferase [Rubrobacter sp.]|nr:GNAT family N-acetyltransferase [Rubrobacter sp.]
MEERTLTLRDGTRVRVREYRPDDAPALERMFGRLSDRTRYLRYFGPTKELPRQKLRRFSGPDGGRRLGLVALDPEDPREIIAFVCYDREGEEDAAEYAAVVEDRYQGRGLGLEMTRLLVAEARERGIRHLYALVLPENRRMLGLPKKLELPDELSWEDGVERVNMRL